jgi:hypothetical protein
MMDRRGFLRGSLAAAAVAGVGVSTRGATAAPSAASAAQLALGPVQHVVAIVVDGLTSSVIAKMPAVNTPGLTRMRRFGATTLNARTLTEKVSTLPNHASMLTGRPARLEDGGHGVVYGNDERQNTIHDAAGEYVPSVFDVVHDRGLRTELYASKSKFAFFDRSWNGTTAEAPPVGVQSGDKIDLYGYGEPDEITDWLVSSLTGSAAPAFAMMCLEQTDEAGHIFGFETAAYRQAVRQADAQIMRVLDTVASDTVLRGNTVVVVVSDHGGYDKGHVDPTKLRNFKVPFLVWGAGVARGADLYALNAGGRRDPGTSQPPYDATVAPIRVAEVANLTTHLLGLPVVPTSRIGSGPALRTR